MIKNKGLFFAGLLLLLSGCTTNNLVDTNMDLPENNWSYPNKAKATVEIKDINKFYGVYFKLRVTADYRYSNIFILFTEKNTSGKRTLRRYGYKLAAADGQWLGKGSGNIYTYKLNLFTSHRFAEAGKYELTIEQNMRDNPLKGVSDIGIVVEEEPK